MIRTYSELCKFETFEERFRYLALNGAVAVETFGSGRYLNQRFYNSSEWKRLRGQIILRDNGCDLGVPGYEINERLVIHHMNPVLINDIIHQSEFLLNPEYLICTTYNTHNAIHYGDESLLPLSPIKRTEYDTCPWKH